MEKLNGKFIEFDSVARRSVIEGEDGRLRFVRPYGFRKTTNLQISEVVSFTSWNFVDGLIGLDIEPIEQQPAETLANMLQPPELGTRLLA